MAHVTTHLRRASPGAPSFAAPESPWRLPWLESMQRLGRRGGPAFPKRFAVLFMGNGVNEDHWGRKGSGAAMKLSKTLQLARTAEAQDQRHPRAVQQTRHRQRHSSRRRPAACSPVASIQKGADRQGRASPSTRCSPTASARTRRSPASCWRAKQPMTGYHETNFSMAYSSHISWQSADSPVPNEVYPSLALDSLFENRGSLRNLSILDRVKDDAADAERSRSARATRPSSTNTSPACAKWRSASSGCARPKTSADDRAKEKNRPALTMDAPGQRPARRPSRAHAADVRHHRASRSRPTRRGSRRCFSPATSSALYYPFLDVRRRAPRRVARQHFRRLRAHRALPPEPARLSGRRSSTACPKATAPCSTTRA